MLCDIIPEQPARAKRNKRSKHGELVYHVTRNGKGAVGQLRDNERHKRSTKRR